VYKVENKGEDKMSLLEKLIVFSLISVGGYLVLGSMTKDQSQAKNNTVKKLSLAAQSIVSSNDSTQDVAIDRSQTEGHIYQDQTAQYQNNNYAANSGRAPASVSMATGSLRVVGIIQSSRKPRAMIKDSANNTYIVSKAQKIGDTGYLLKEVREGSIVVSSASMGANLVLSMGQ
jgi:competence protein ComGC